MKKFTAIPVVYGLAFTLFYFALPVPSYAQGKAADQPSAAAQSAVSDSELKAFAKAYVKFHQIRAEYEPKLNVAKTQEEKSKVEQEAVAKFGAALDQQRLTMQRYGALFQIVSADQGLRDKALKLIEEERAKS